MMTMLKPVTVLYLGSLTHSDETNFTDKSKPHQDEIDFASPVKIGLIRIPRCGKDIYSRHTSITQIQPIKNFQIYYRNLEKSNGRYSLLISNNQLVTNLTDDVLITPKQNIFTDLLVFKGNFTKITLCIYGNVIREESFIRQKLPCFRQNIPIEPFNQNLIQIKHDIFAQKREALNKYDTSFQDGNNVDQWGTVLNDDGINEQQIENICNISQKLLNTFSSQQLSQQSFVTEFRSGLQQIGANLAKIFKNKHIGLYYPSYEDSSVQNDLPFSVTSLAISSLDLSLSQQFRGLEILKFMLQLDRHSNFFIQNHGVQKLIRIFVDFFKIGTVVLSTYKNLILQVLISISHWKKGAQKLTTIMQDPYYLELFQEKKALEKQKNIEQRDRSREKKTKRSRSESSSSSQDEDKKKKKDKNKKLKKDIQRQKQKEKKKGKQSKTKQQIYKKGQEPQLLKSNSLKQQTPQMSFYEVLLMQLTRQTNIKQLILVKILLQQILQTITKNKIVSHRVSLSTSLLKDTKYIFNPAGQVLNTKSLKQFASCYQPFLNNIQSAGTDSQFISEREKLKNKQKYGINPNICKIINKLSLKIAQSQSQQTSEEARTAFDSDFIVMMSQLIRDKQKSLLYGFGRILTCFKIESSNDIIYLKKIEGAMTMISQYIYKILVQDNGLYTVLNIDQIYTSLINITNCLSKDSSSFTKQLKRKIRQLTNYALAYDLFNRSQGNFKTICDYFLKLFKFDQYEINKISDFKKKQFDKLNQPFSISNLTQIINLGNFHQLFPQQPLLQIDVYLKIFTIVLQYNKNVWSLFYQNKLVCGFSVLYIKLTNFLLFILESSNQRQYVLTNMKKCQVTVQNHLNVVNRLVNLLAKKAQYETAFNDLIEQDSFENVELYQRSFQVYVSLFNAINTKSSLLTKKSKALAKSILSLIIQIYDKLFESYELTNHISKQSKIKQLWYMIYEKHFVNLKSRAACLSLYAFFIQSMQNSTIKLFNTYCIEENLKLQIYAEHAIKGYIPNNQKSIIENFLISNIFRNDATIQTNLCYLIKNLLQKHSQKNPTCQKITPYLQNIFDQIQNKLKQKGNCIFENKKELILVQKMVLLTDILRKLNALLTVKFQDKLLKFLKFVDYIKPYIQSIKNNSTQNNSYQKIAYKLALKIKVNITSFLKKTFSQKLEHSQTLSFVQTINKYLDIPQLLLKQISQNNLSNLPQIQYTIQQESLNLVNSSLEVISALAYNPYAQSVMLYEVFLQKPYKPVPQIMLVNLWNKINSSQMAKLINSQDNQIIVQNLQTTIQKDTSNLGQLRKTLKQIIVRLTYFLCQLTTIQSRQFYSTESRRLAISYILTQQKDFPFHNFDQFKSFIPNQFIQTLKDYFSYPIIQKPLVIKRQQKKEVTKNKGYTFSKTLFAIIMQGQLTAKSRYPFIGGPWKSGDISSNFIYTPSRQRNYDKNVSKFIKPLNFLSDKLQLSLNDKKPVYKQSYVQPELFQLSTKRRPKIVQKKVSMDTQTKLINVPLVLQNHNMNRMDQSQMMKKISPSPSKKFPSNGGYYKPNQPLSSSQYDGMKRLKSPSPPPINISSQNMMGFSSNTNNQPLSYNTGLNPQNMPPYNMQNPSMLQSNQTSYVPSSLAPLPNLSGTGGISMSNTATLGLYKKQSGMNPSITKANEYPQYPNPIGSHSHSQHIKYPNPYSGGGVISPSKSAEIPQSFHSVGTSYPSQLHRANSQEQPSNTVIQQPIRSSSNSLGRQDTINQNNYNTPNTPYNSSDQPSYYNNTPHNTPSYPNVVAVSRMATYENRSHSPYQKNSYQSGNTYLPNQRNPQYNNLPSNVPQSSYYRAPNTGTYASTPAYQPNNPAVNNPQRQGGYNNQTNRSYDNNRPGYTNYSNMGGNYGNSNYARNNPGFGGSNTTYGGPTGSNYGTGTVTSPYGTNNNYNRANLNYTGGSTYQNGNTNYSQNLQQQRQFNDAILLFTELRGNLPEQMKLQKKNRLNQILTSNIKVQNRVKQFINNLKG